VALVDPVQHGLADQVAADGEHLHVVLFQQLALGSAVLVVGHGLVDLEVIAPAGQLEAVESEAAALGGQSVQTQIGPLARKHGHRSRHRRLLLARKQGAKTGATAAPGTHIAGRRLPHILQAACPGVKPLEENKGRWVRAGGGPGEARNVL